MDYISETAARRVRMEAPIYSGPAGAKSAVQDIKEAAARMITLIEQIDTDECPREKALAVTHIQTACMFGVFAATA